MARQSNIIRVAALLAMVSGTACSSTKFGSNIYSAGPTSSPQPAAATTPASADSDSPASSPTPATSPTPAPNVPTPSPAASDPLQVTTNATIPPPGPSLQQVSLSCAQLSNPLTSVVTVTAKNGVAPIVQVVGDFCPLATGALTVLYIVDWSGSMATSDPTPAGATTCGRLQAIQQIDNYLRANNSTNVSVQEGMIPFSAIVDTTTILPFGPASNFSSRISFANVCQHDTSTNYIAALNQAQQMLKGVAGRTVIYFISDGLPTVAADGTTVSSGTDPTVESDTYAAAAALRNAVTGLTINGLFLDGADDTTSSASASALTVMANVAGNSNHVLSAANASQLATQILNFPPPTLTTASAKATLTVPGGTASSVSLISFAAVPGQASEWQFVTGNFSPAVHANAVTQSTVVVTTPVSDGSTAVATVTVNVTDSN